MGKIYVTKQGDTWDTISDKVYGTADYTHLILDANLSLSHISFFSAGTKINIPDIDSSTSSETGVNLPPWRSNE